MTDTLAPHYQKAIAAMRPAIEALYRQYEGFSTHWVEKDELPAAELEPFLARLDINYPDSSHLRIKLAIWAQIQRLSCFKYRVIHRRRTGQRLEPAGAATEGVAATAQRRRAALPRH